MKNLTTFGKFLLAFLIVGSLIGTKLYFDHKKGKDVSLKGLFTPKEDIVRVGVVAWPGYAGGQLFNKGFLASEKSRYFTEYGMKVEFVVINELEPSRAAFKKGDIDLLWTTADAFCTESSGLQEYGAKIIFQSDWSRGGDAIVARKGINSVNDIKPVNGIKKKISVAIMSPSHTFLLKTLESSGISPEDVEIIQVDDAIKSATMFKAGEVDLAVVWSPDDLDCISSISGSTILLSTKSAGNIIADVFIAKDEYLKSHKDQVQHLIEGWMIGAAEINSNPKAKQEAAQILAEGLNLTDSFCYKMLDNVRLCTIGDNQDFFGLNGSYRGVKGSDLYEKMTSVYTKYGFISGNVPSWRDVSNISFIDDIELAGAMHESEGIKRFEKTEADKTAVAISTKPVSISFPTNAFDLTDDAKYTIDKEFVDVAKGFSNLKIRIEGNTDNTGNPDFNKNLSLKRAESVYKYLVSEYGFDPNRFTVIGNGQNKPIADNTTDDGKAQNRRTDFELIPQ